MYLTWLGHACFKIQTKNNGEEVVLVTDPFDPSIGLKLPRSLKADVVTISHQHTDHNYLAGVDGQPFVIQAPGEYETKKIFIYGAPSWHDKSQGKERGENVIYRIELEDLVVVHLGDIGHSLTNGQLEQLQNTDILLIPVGGTYTINYKEAAEIVNQIEPRLVVPMHYRIPDLNLRLDGVEKFCKEMGLCGKPQTGRVKIIKKDLPVDKMEILILEKE